MPYEWFKRLGDISGMEYTPAVAVDSSRLPGKGLEPRIERYSSGEHVWWPDPVSGGNEGSGSASPAGRHTQRLSGRSDVAPEEIIRVVTEALELPGSRSDYHFTLLSGWQALWKSRRKDARAYEWFEHLCWTDIYLLKLGAELVFAEDHWQDDEGNQFNPIGHTFVLLRDLYEREGMVEELQRLTEVVLAVYKGALPESDLEERLHQLANEEAI